MLTIFWDNPNVIGHDSTQIFRKSEKEGEFSLIGQCDSVDLEYTDTTVPTINKVYWYRVDFVDEFMATADSVEFSMGYYPTGTGPGPQELLRGTWELGFFGYVNVGDLPNFETIGNGFIYPRNKDAPTLWCKCVVQSNIIYVPDMIMYNGTVPPASLSLFLPTPDGATDVINEVFHNGDYFSARPPYLSRNRRNQKMGYESEQLTTSPEITRFSEVGAISSIVSDTMPELFGGVYKLNGLTFGQRSNLPTLTSTPSQNGTWLTNKFPPSSVLETTDQNCSVFIILELLFD